ncbi:uncharacterized protein LOC143888688 [Tasmannia lanceolata]|uniref:uncharacterized protein LOC143888688 n=1 Tax=Tasmannia lanceolata TaxID=3420 RepID=UPI00406283CA
MATASALLFRIRRNLQRRTRAPYESGYLTHREYVTGITHAENHCVAVLHMDVRCFRTFVAILRNTALLGDTIHCCVEEQVAIFLQILGHRDRNRHVRAVITRSGAMVSKYFNKVLDAMLNIRHLFILLPSTETPHQIAGNQNWMPYFKDCIGAIDGTRIHVRVSAELNGRFWCRKGYPSQNVLAACDFDMKFTYVLAGWEGSASDSRVLASALSLSKPIPCPPGKYYLADAGREMPNDGYIEVVDRELAEAPPEEIPPPFPLTPISRAEDVRVGGLIRTGKMASTSGVSKGRKKNNHWGEDEDRLLVTSLANQVAEGNKIANGFKELALNAVAQDLIIRIGRDITKDHVRNRMKTMKTNYRIVHTILSRSGFGWDTIQCKISVEDEVKNDYLQSTPGHLRFFNTCYPLYEEWKYVFGEDHATGEFLDDSHAPSQDDFGTFPSNDPVGLDNMADRFPPVATPPGPPRCSKSRHSSPVRDASMGFSDSSPVKAPTPGSSGKRRRGADAKLGQNMDRLSDSIRMMADAITSIAEVHDLSHLKDSMMSMENFSYRARVRAYMYLHTHHKEAEVFLSLEDEGRHEVVIAILEQ